MTLSRASVLALAVSTALFAGAAAAATDTDDFTVSITIENDCTISVGDIDFNTQTDLTTAHTASSTGTVTCTGAGAWAVAFSDGTSGDAALREMTDGTDTITYNLYRDAVHTEILGAAANGDFEIASSGDDTFTVYGQTTAGQGAKDNGTYTDTITATLTF